MSRTHDPDRRALLERLLQLAHEQHDAMLAEDIEAFMVCMPERATIIAALTQPPEEAALSAPADDEAARALAALFAEVVAQDRENERLLRLQMESARIALAGIARWQSAAQGYLAALAIDCNGALVDVAS
jgi:hypothetical protein